MMMIRAGLGGRVRDVDFYTKKTIGSGSTTLQSLAITRCLAEN